MAEAGTVVREWLFPSDLYCICCGNAKDIRYPYGLCGECVRNLHWAIGDVCALCGKPLPESETAIRTDGGEERLCADCSESGRTFQRGVTCVWYGLLERELMQRFKYGGNSQYGEMLGLLMAERWEAEGLQADMIVPAPMYPCKEVRRGYNQARLLALAMGRKTGLPVNDRILLRIRETPPMSGLGGGERRGNLRNALAVDRRKTAEITGKRILLVDDVFTTGTTAESCASLLLEAGASAVYLATFAATAGRVETDASAFAGFMTFF